MLFPLTLCSLSVPPLPRFKVASQPSSSPTSTFLFKKHVESRVNNRKSKKKKKDIYLKGLSWWPLLKFILNGIATQKESIYLRGSTVFGQCHERGVATTWGEAGFQSARYRTSVIEKQPPKYISEEIWSPLCQWWHIFIHTHIVYCRMLKIARYTLFQTTKTTKNLAVSYNTSERLDLLHLPNEFPNRSCNRCII